MVVATARPLKMLTVGGQRRPLNQSQEEKNISAGIEPLIDECEMKNR